MTDERLEQLEDRFEASIKRLDDKISKRGVTMFQGIGAIAAVVTLMVMTGGWLANVIYDVDQRATVRGHVNAEAISSLNTWLKQHERWEQSQDQRIADLKQDVAHRLVEIRDAITELRATMVTMLQENSRLNHTQRNGE